MDTVPKPTRTDEENAAAFETEFVAWLEDPDDFAVRDLLAAGWPVYYADDDTPAGLVIKEYPDGRRQLVRGWGADEQVVRDL